MTRANVEQQKNTPWFAKAGAACSIVPISRFVSEHIFALKGGGYGCLFSLAGVDEEGLTDLEEIFLAEGSTPEEIEAAKEDGDGLGLFVRSLIGLDREAAKVALSGFMRAKTLTANQIEFINLIINYLSQRGWIELARLYASPFTDLHPHGLDGLFDEPSTLALIGALQAVRRNAVGVSVQ